MLLITQSIKTLFKKVFVLLLMIELILLITVLIFFLYNTLNLSSNLNKSQTFAVIKNRDLFNEYLENKFLFLIEDNLMIMKVYENIEKWRQIPANHNIFTNITESMIFENCSNFGGLVPKNSTNNLNWYSTPKDLMDGRFKGTWYNGLEQVTYDELAEIDQEKLVSFCIMNQCMKTVIKKNLIWQKFYSVTLDYLDFSFSNSFFYKYPMFYNAYMSPGWTDTSRGSCVTERSINEYDPKCRPFYTYSISQKSKIVITKPYKFASTQEYGNDLCIKSKYYDNSIPIPVPKLIICSAINYNDLLHFSPQLSLTLGANKKIIMVYPDYSVNINSPELLVVFTTSNSPSSYFSMGSYLGLNNNAPNTLSEIYYLNVFKNFQNSTDAQKEALKPIYEEAQNFFNANIQSRLSKSVINYNSTNAKYISSSNYKKFNTSNYLISLNQTYTFKDNNISLLTNIYQNIYIFPITVSYDYQDDYQLITTQQFSFYLIFMNQESNINQKVQSFFFIVLYEIFFYFFFIITLKIMIWIIYGIFLSYFLKGFLAPIKQINELLHEHFFMNYRKENGVLHKSYVTYKKSYLDYKLTSCFNSLFKLSDYEDINECLITLKMLNITRDYKASSLINYNLNFKLGVTELHMENMVDAMFFLMYNIPEKLLQDSESDPSMITKLIYTNFVYKINSNCSKSEIDHFYEDITEIVEMINSNKLNLRKASYFSRKSILNQNSEKIEYRIIQDESKLKLIYKKLKETVQYRYCIYKLKFMETDLDMNQLDDQIEETEFKTYNEYNEMNESNNSFNGLNEHQHLLKKDPKEKNILNSEKEKNIGQIQILVDNFDQYISSADTNFEDFKCIAAHIIQAGLLFSIKQENEGIKQCIKALEKLKNLQEIVTKFGKITKLAYICVSNLFFEKILYLLSTLSERFDQKKTQFYLYCNILDLGPVYDRRIRIYILQKLLKYLESEHKYKKNVFQSDEEKFEATKHTKIVKHKLRAIENMTKKIPKNILLLLDLSCPLIKEKDFLEIIVSQTESNKNFIYFSCFDHQLYIYKNRRILEDSQFNDENSLFSEQMDEEDVINLYDEDFNDGDDTERNKLYTNIDDYNNHYKFFKFINDYNKNKSDNNKSHRVDYAIKKVLRFYNFQEEPKNNNFIFVFTTIDSKFDFADKINKIQISGLLFKCKYTLIVCIMYEEKIFEQPVYKRKYENYKKFIESGIVNGHLFLIKSFSLVKFIINCASPQQFKQFDFDSLKSYIKVVDSEFNMLENRKLLNDMLKESQNNFETLSEDEVDVEFLENNIL